MATAVAPYHLPWNEHQEDRLFRWLTGILVVVFLLAGFVFNLLTLPEPERQQLVDVSPRLAKLILEKKTVEPKPVPKPVVPEKKEVEPKKEVKEKPKVEPPKPKKQRETARETAKKSGLLAASDELADLRNSLDLGNLLQQPQQAADRKAVDVTTSSNILSAASSTKSGGIQTNTLSREVTTSELATRQVAKVESNIDTSSVSAAKVQSAKTSTQGRSSGRNPGEIARVFEANKARIFAIYNRALRNNPNLMGKVLFEITIAPNGGVTEARIVSSELGDPDLEKKLLLRIKRFQFASTGVSSATVTYPIDFLPS